MFSVSELSSTVFSYTVTLFSDDVMFTITNRNFDATEYDHKTLGFVYEKFKGQLSLADSKARVLIFGLRIPSTIAVCCFSLFNIRSSIQLIMNLNAQIPEEVDEYYDQVSPQAPKRGNRKRAMGESSKNPPNKTPIRKQKIKREPQGDANFDMFSAPYVALSWALSESMLTLNEYEPRYHPSETLFRDISFFKITYNAASAEFEEDAGEVLRSIETMGVMGSAPEQRIFAVSQIPGLCMFNPL